MTADKKETLDKAPLKAVDCSQRIGEQYKSTETSQFEATPTRKVAGLEDSTAIRRIAVYIRVGTGDEQTSSYNLQNDYYTEYIKVQPGWKLVGIYSDEGFGIASMEDQKGMQQLIEDCKAGKIDLVLTKSVARFARNLSECFSVIETLNHLNPPVGVKFETDDIYTLDSSFHVILTTLALLFEEKNDRNTRFE